MWFYTENNTIISGPIRLARLWADANGDQHPLSEMGKRAAISRLNDLGWYKQIIVPTSHNINTEKVIGYNDIITGLEVFSTELIGPFSGADTTSRVGNLKRIKIEEVKGIAVVKANAIFDDIDSFGQMQVMINLWQSIAPAARNPTAKMTDFIAVAQAARNAVTAIRALSDPVAIDAYDSNTDPTWP